MLTFRGEHFYFWRYTHRSGDETPKPGSKPVLLDSKILQISRISMKMNSIY
jgi:hypothetical protein